MATRFKSGLHAVLSYIAGLCALFVIGPLAIKRQPEPDADADSARNKVLDKLRTSGFSALTPTERQAITRK